MFLVEHSLGKNSFKNHVKAFFLRNFYRSQLLKLQEHPIMAGRLFQRINYGGVMYYHVGKYVCLKSKNQHKDF